jgi:hypothetical protein
MINAAGSACQQPVFDRPQITLERAMTKVRQARGTLSLARRSAILVSGLPIAV